jgi:hypothetical protein
MGCVEKGSYDKGGRPSIIHKLPGCGIACCEQAGQVFFLLKGVLDSIQRYTKLMAIVDESNQNRFLLTT